MSTLEVREMTAGDVAAKDLDTKFMVKGGKVWYEQARFTRAGTHVRLSRIKQGATIEDGLSQINIYVELTAPLIVQINETARIQLNEL